MSFVTWSFALPITGHEWTILMHLLGFWVSLLQVVQAKKGTHIDMQMAASALPVLLWWQNGIKQRQFQVLCIQCPYPSWTPICVQLAKLAAVYFCVTYVILTDNVKQGHTVIQAIYSTKGANESFSTDHSLTIWDFFPPVGRMAGNKFNSVSFASNIQGQFTIYPQKCWFTMFTFKLICTARYCREYHREGNHKLVSHHGMCSGNSHSVFSIFQTWGFAGDSRDHDMHVEVAVQCNIQFSLGFDLCSRFGAQHMKYS